MGWGGLYQWKKLEVGNFGKKEKPMGELAGLDILTQSTKTKAWKSLSLHRFSLSLEKQTCYVSIVVQNKEKKTTALGC